MTHILAATVNVTPNTSLPGTHALTSLVGGLLTIAMVVAVLGVILSAISMAVGHHSGNSRLGERGRTGLLVSFIAAIVLGGADALVNFALGVGGRIH